MTNSATARADLAFLLPMLLRCPGAWAQFASAIEGTVLDSSGAVVPGATVTITNEETGVTQNAPTSERRLLPVPGARQRPLHDPGRASGVQTVVQEHVRLQAAETKTINLALDVGATEEEVTVAARRRSIETAQGRVSGLIEESQVKELPARRPQLLQPRRAHPGRAPAGRRAARRPTRSRTRTSTTTSSAST